ncbi:hypothetical protein PybrP1_000913 [[Pythium] brassicae (nom. inval.)]|nr:hypothetical protein PybrP1_000913 [[Pythium] brassicae (nom. inval.)]
MRSPTDWRAEHPSADERRELQTLKARVCRRAVLGALYFWWVCGVTGVTGMSLYSLFALARSALSRNATPLPRSVRGFALFMALYEAYHRLTPGLHRWDTARRFLGHMLRTYPYFRRTVCVFEAAEDRKVALPGHAPPEQPASLQEPALKPDDKALFAFHPHGILACGFGMNGVHGRAFTETNTRWLVAENLFWFPGMRELLHWMDSDSVQRETFVALMARGQNLAFLPGGFEDATLFRRGRHRVFLNNRFGFIKLALQYGYKIYPVYTFGEELTYTALPHLLPLRLKLNAFRVPAALFIGSPWCFFMPRSDADLVTVVGNPLQLPTIPAPTTADVQQYHALYVRALQALFDKFKGTYAADPDATLEVY